MASVKIPAWPKGVARGVWANRLASAAVYAIESNVINYDTGTSINIFSIPEDSILLGVGLEVVTAFDVYQANIIVKDTAETLCRFEERAVDTTGFRQKNLMKRYAKRSGAGRGTREIQVDVNTTTGGLGTTGSAGVGRIWIFLKPNRESPLRKDYVGSV